MQFEGVADLRNRCGYFPGTGVAKRADKCGSPGGIYSKRENLERYRKRLKYYARLQLLFIDDFAISRYSEDGIIILYHLIKTRTDLGTSTMFTCQYAPSEWGKQLSDEEGCYGKLDGIRRRLTTGYTVHIERL